MHISISGACEIYESVIDIATLGNGFGLR